MYSGCVQPSTPIKDSPPKNLPAPTLPELWAELQPWWCGGPLVAHNVSTERGIVRHAAPMHTIGPWIDTLTLARDGALVWEADLPAPGYTTPAIYRAGGKPYVVVAAGGGHLGPPSGSEYVAFGFPEP